MNKKNSNENALDTPAIYCNRVALTMNLFGIRLSFGESLNGEAAGEQYHQAVFMPMQIFLELKKMCDQVISQIPQNQNEPSKH